MSFFRYEFLGNQVWQYGAFFLILLGAGVVHWLLRRLWGGFLSRRQVPDERLQAALAALGRRPLGIVLFLLALWGGLQVFSLPQAASAFVRGLFVAVANRPKKMVPAEPRSRGLLCRELLNHKTAKEAADHAAQELTGGCYAGANYLCADAHSGAVVYGGDRIELVELTPGLHLMTNGNLDDLADERQEFVRRLLTLQRLDSAVAFLAVASRTFSRKADSRRRRGLIVSGNQYGTVSSTLVSVATKKQNAIFQYAPGPPCRRSPTC